MRRPAAALSPAPDTDPRAGWPRQGRGSIVHATAIFRAVGARVDSAARSGHPASPRRCLSLARSFLAGLGAGVALVWSGLATGATVYRWVDEHGRAHFSDTVPESVGERAQAVTLPGGAPSEAERQRARRQAEQDRARADAAAAARGRDEDGGRAPPPPDDTPQKRPAQPPAEDADCDTWHRLYWESLDCFGPYRTVRGGVRQEAFDHCTEVREPPSRCRRRTR